MTELQTKFALRLGGSSKSIQQSIGMISTVASNISAIAASCTLPPNRSRSVCPMRRSAVWCTPLTVLAECLLPFDPNGVAVRLDEIDDWSNHAKLLWEVAFRTVGKLSD